MPHCRMSYVAYVTYVAYVAYATRWIRSDSFCSLGAKTHVAPSLSRSGPT